MDTLFDTPPSGTTKAKTIRILVYPNITYAKDLTKDSYVVYLTNAIRQLNCLRDDLFFTFSHQSIFLCWSFRIHNNW